MTGLYVLAFYFGGAVALAGFTAANWDGDDDPRTTREILSRMPPGRVLAFFGVITLIWPAVLLWQLARKK